MDINELESFKLSDAVTFHKELNPKLWEDDKLDPEVRDQLLLIAEDFVEYLGLSNLKVKDVTISGSNAAYSYTPHSDLDLHILVDFDELPDNEVYQELFTAKKTLYNDQHDITVRDVPVELYVQDINQPVQSLGEYSIVHDKWIRIPKKRRANFDEAATKAKYEKLGDLIELALKSKDPKRVNDAIALIKRYRKSGLDKHGEFGPENLAYKAVRTQGLVQALYDLKAQLHGEKLSIEEAASRDDALIKIKKLMQTAGRTPAEKDNIKRIVAKMMHQWQIDPAEIGARQSIDPLKAKIAKAAYEKNTAANMFKQEWERFKKGIFAEEETDEDYDPNGPPPGPEFKPTMPAGTVKVDVSDVYDWYKLGQHISNMKGLGKHDFGKGPPSTILSFGDEDTEHKYIKDLEKTGLTTTDIDPIDPKQPKGMKRQKTDPTYNVNEAPVTGNYADLYHTAWTDTGALDSILQSGKLIPGTNKWLSLTRDSRLDYAKMMGQFAEFVIDQNKLRQRIKLHPYDDFKGKGADEAGERVNVPIPLKGYVKSIHLPASWKHNEKARQYYEPQLKQYGIPFYYDTMGSPEDRNADVPRLEEASGYIPSAKEKNDPRFKTALTVDVKPDSIKKNAKAFNWKTSRAGIPPQARADGKIAEDLMKEWNSFLAEDQEQQELFPGYNEKHRQERLNAWLGKSHAMAGKKPKVLYHATTKDFDQFRVQNQGWVSGSFFGNTQVDRTGIFLADNPKFAEEFIKNNGTGPEWKENAKIIPVYMSAQYPFSLLDDSLSPMLSDEATVQEFKEHDIDLWSIYQHFNEDKRWELFDGPEGEEFVNNLKRLGYDSAVMREEAHSHGGSELVWVAFDPSQVKAITNRGSFSPDDPRMMKENG